MSLYSIDAEDKVISFLLGDTPQDKKDEILHLLHKDLFSVESNKKIFHAIKLHKVFDPIVLLERVPKGWIERTDILALNEKLLPEQARSYVEILLDKFQRRRLYEFGQKIQDDIIKGADQFELALQSHTLLTSLGTKVKLDSNQELLTKVLEESPQDILSTGYATLDEYLGGYTRGMIITVAGDSGHMKTTFAMDAAFRMAEKNPNAKIGIFSKEMLDVDLIKKQISRVCSIPINQIFAQDYDKALVKEKMSNYEPWANNRIKIINPNSFNGVTDIAKIQMTHRFDIWILDFIQLLEFSKSAANASDYNIGVAQNMRDLQSLALMTKSAGIILSQVRKGVEQRALKKPTISDIEWSGLIKQLSSYILFSYYPNKYYGNRISDKNYYLLGEKTRFAAGFTFAMEVEPTLGSFREVDAKKRTELITQLSKILTI